jgi:copper homeostasis protein CutC
MCDVVVGPRSRSCVVLIHLISTVVCSVQKLVAVSAGRLSIMAGAGLTEQNAKEVVAATGVTWIHGSLRERVQSRMKYQKPNVFLVRYRLL